MNLKHDVRKWVFEAVRLSPAPQDLKDVIRNAEKNIGKFPRLNTFITNLEREINAAVQVNMFRGKANDLETVKGLVYDFTTMFLKNCEAEARRKHESDLARLARDAKSQEVKDMEKTLQGTPSGIFEEGGVVVDETRKDEIFKAPRSP